jgi:hypothetical protein
MRKVAVCLALCLASPALADGVSSVPVVAPVATAAAPDPARLAAARVLALKLVPPGIYRRLLQGALGPLIDQMMGQMADMPVKKLMEGFGVSDEALAKLGSASSRQIMTIVDPAFEERMHLVMKAMMGGMADTFDSMEPDIREAFAEAYAGSFDVAQLDQLNTFFATPTGAVFATRSLTLMSDPAVVRRMQTLMPAIMQRLPDIMKQAQTATAGLPKPKTADELSEADRKKLASILDIDPAKLKKGNKS